MPQRPSNGARAVKRTLAITATAAMAVSGAAFGSAAVANADDVTPNTVSVTSSAQWTKAGDPTAFDYTTNANGSVRFSNDLANPDLYGALSQLNTPVVQDAGEGTNNNTFTEEFTLGAESYDAQPGLAIEVDADKGGNRAGGNLLLREDSNHTLSLASFFIPEGHDGDDVSDWVAKTADVDFTKPVDVKYVDHFVTDGQDIVKVYVNGDLVISGSTFEGYHDQVEGDKEAVNSILFRTGYRKADPSGFGWTDETPTTDQAAALAGKGFDFSNVKLTSSNTVAVQTATTKKIQLADIGAEGESYPSNDFFVGAPASGETAGVPTVAGGKLVVPATTQILHGFAADARPTDLTSFIDSGLSWVQDGTAETGAFFQIPVGYGDGHFTTLRPVSVTPGTNTAGWDQQWVSSNGQFTGTLGQIVDQIDAIGNTHIYGFGVYAQDATGVTSIQAGTTKYTFAQDPSISASVTISGTPQVGQTLTANVDASATTGTTTKYQWYYNGKKLTTNATGKTYTIPYSRLGQQLSVKATVSKSGFTTGTGTSAKTAKVIAGVFSEVSVTSPATAQVGKSLSAAVTSSPAASHVTYQWYVNGLKVKDATKSTYTPSGSQAGEVVHVRATLTKSGYTTDAVSAADQPIAVGALTLGAVTVTGTPAVGKTLTIKVGKSTSGVKFTYLIVTDEGENLVAVQTTSTFKIPAYLKGTKIEVSVIATKAGYHTEQGFSAETATIQ